MIPLGFFGGQAGVFNTWSRTSIPASMVQNGAIYTSLTNGKYFIFGSSSTGATTTTYYYSNDGSTWSTGTLPGSSEAGQPVSNGTTLVINSRAGYGATTTTSTFYSTTDGTTWTTRSQPSNQALYQGVHDGTYYLYTSTTNQSIIYSTDGNTFSAVSTGFNVSGPIATNGIGKTMVKSSLNFRICTSNPTVAANWVTCATQPTNTNIAGIVYGNGKWLVYSAAASGGSNAYSYSSDDGATWTLGTLPVSIATGGSFDNQFAIQFSGSVFYLAYDNSVYSSVDGVNWVTTSTHGTGLTFSSMGSAVSQDKMLIVGSARTTSTGSTTILTGTP